MNKEDFILLLRSQITGTTALTIIRNYCIEFNKEEKYINLLIEVLKAFPLLIRDFLNVSIEYFKTKYKIVELYDSNHNLIKIL